MKIKSVFFALAFVFWGLSQLHAQEGVIGLEPSVTPTLVPEQTTPPAQPEASPAEDLTQDRPWLSDLYSWHESYNLNRGGVSAQRAGAYCVGNGHAFALVGLESPLWDWSDLYGDSYQEPDLGHMQMGLSRDGAEVALPQQQIGWVRRSGVVKVRA